MGSNMQGLFLSNAWRRFGFDFRTFGARKISRETGQHGRMPRLNWIRGWKLSDGGNDNPQVWAAQRAPRKSQTTAGHGEIRLNAIQSYNHIQYFHLIP